MSQTTDPPQDATGSTGEQIVRTQKALVDARFREDGLAENRFVNVFDGAKGSPDEHSDPSNRYDSPKAIHGNYGVYAGDGLVDVDIDDYNDGAHLDGVNRLPDTLTVESPHTDGERGGHKFFNVVPGEEFETAQEACESVWATANPSPSWGELRADNQYVVGAGSQLDGCTKEWCDCCAEPDGGWYEIAEYEPIATITADELAEVLRKDPERPEQDANPTESNTQRRDYGDCSFSVSDEHVERAREILNDLKEDSRTTQRYFSRLMQHRRGRYLELGHESDDGSADHSEAEQSLCTDLYGALFWATDGEIDDDTARQLIYADVTHACNEQEYADDGDRRKWACRGDNYRLHTIGNSIDNFNNEWWERSRMEKEEPYQHTGDYGEPMYRYVLQAAHVAYERVEGYPSKDDVLDVAQNLNPERERTSHEECLRRLRADRGKVRKARRGSTEHLYYPADEPDPDGACYVKVGGEKIESN